MAIRLTGATVALLVTLSGAMASAYQARYMSHTGVAFHIPTSDPGIELRILQTVRYGRRVSIAIYNPGRTAVRFRPHCGTMTMRNAQGCRRV